MDPCSPAHRHFPLQGCPPGPISPNTVFCYPDSGSDFSPVLTPTRSPIRSCNSHIHPAGQEDQETPEKHSGAHDPLQSEAVFARVENVIVQRPIESKPKKLLHRLGGSVEPSSTHMPSPPTHRLGKWRSYSCAEIEEETRTLGRVQNHQDLNGVSAEWSDFDKYGIDIDLFVGSTRICTSEILRQPQILNPNSGENLSRDTTNADHKNELLSESLQHSTGSKILPHIDKTSIKGDSLDNRHLTKVQVAGEDVRRGGMSPLRAHSLNSVRKRQTEKFAGEATRKSAAEPRTAKNMKDSGEGMKKEKKGIVKSLRRWLSGPIELPSDMAPGTPSEMPPGILSDMTPGTVHQ